MLLIECPWCGEREQTEFSYHGEAHIVRPATPDSLSDDEWANYLFFRKNPKGVHYERWMHAFGCRRYFNMARHTVSGEIYGTYRMDANKPAAALAADSSAEEVDFSVGDGADSAPIANSPAADNAAVADSAADSDVAVADSSADGDVAAAADADSSADGDADAEVVGDSSAEVVAAVPDSVAKSVSHS